MFLQSEERFWPLYEAKMVHHFTHRFGDYALKRPDYGKNDLPTPDDATLANPAYAPLPRYWVAEAEVERQLAGRWGRGWLLGWRNVCRNTDERTVIAAILPRVAVGHSMPLLFASVATPALYACLLANLSAFVLDYAARQKLGGLNLTYGYLMQLPILPPHAYSRWCHGRGNSPRVTGSVNAFSSLPIRRTIFATWPRTWATEPLRSRWDHERRHQLRCELDAAFFHLYGIGRDDIAYIMDTFPIVRDAEQTRWGCYRTKAAILDAYDELRLHSA